MDKAEEIRLEPKKEWTTPKLQHIDIEKVTANTNMASTNIDGMPGKS